MKFGVITIVWGSPFDTAKIGYVNKVAHLGFDYIEACYERPGVMDAGLLADTIAGAGIKATVGCAFDASRDVSSPDKALRAGGVTYLKQSVDFAHRIGAHVISGPMYAASGRCELLSGDERAAELDRAVDSLTEIAEYAGSRDVKLAIEPLNRFESHVVNTAEQCLALCERIGPNAGVHLDTFHMNIEEKSIGQAIRAAGPRIFHFHASENDRGTPGSGHVPWREVADALISVDYEGVVSIESFVPGIPELARAASMWRDINPDGDALARDGLKFLKELFAV